jgi:hypothetical protein
LIGVNPVPSVKRIALPFTTTVTGSPLERLLGVLFLLVFDMPPDPAMISLYVRIMSPIQEQRFVNARSKTKKPTKFCTSSAKPSRFTHQRALRSGSREPGEQTALCLIFRHGAFAYCRVYVP